MCKAMEDMITIEKKMAAVRMLEDEALPKEKIAKYLDLPLSVIEELAKELQPV